MSMDSTNTENLTSYDWVSFCQMSGVWEQCLSQDLETGCLKLAVVKFWGIQIFKGDHNILIFQP